MVIWDISSHLLSRETPQEDIVPLAAYRGGQKSTAMSREGSAPSPCQPMTERAAFAAFAVYSVTESASGLAHLPASCLIIWASIPRIRRFVKSPLNRCVPSILVMLIAIRGFNIIMSIPVGAFPYPALSSLSGGRDYCSSVCHSVFLPVQVPGLPYANGKQ